MKSDFTSLPQDVEIVSATLKVYKYSHYDGYAKATPYNLHEITEQWSESGVNWTTGWSKTGGSYASEVLSSFNYDGSSNGWFEFDVTASVKKYVSDADKNYGFMIDCPGGDDNGAPTMDQESYFYSSESGKSDQLPHIVVEYNSTATLASTKSATQTMPFSVTKRVVSLTNAQEATLRLFTLKGQLLKEVTLQQNQQLDMNSFAKGCVVLQFIGDGTSLTKTISLY